MIELLDYDLDQNLEQDDSDMMAEFLDYSGSTYICDAITEIADSNVGIYHSDIFNNAKNLYFSGAYEEAKSQGLMEGNGDMVRDLQAAWYEYNTQQFYKNIDTLCYNYAATYLNNIGVELTGDQESDLFDIFNNYDHNNTFDDLLDEVNAEFVQDIECEVGVDD